MQCDGIGERLLRMLSGDLSTGEAAAAREHVAGCEPCRSALAAMEQNVEAMSALASAASSLPLAELAVTRFRAARSRERRARGRRRLLVTTAAALALLALWGAQQREQRRHGTPPARAPRPGQVGSASLAPRGLGPRGSGKNTGPLGGTTVSTTRTAEEPAQGDSRVASRMVTRPPLVRTVFAPETVSYARAVTWDAGQDGTTRVSGCTVYEDLDTGVKREDTAVFESGRADSAMILVSRTGTDTQEGDVR